MTSIKRNKNKKLRVGIIFGGKSSEHEVSLQSAKSIISALDPEKYEIVLIGIDKTGRWRLQDNSKYLLNSSDPKLIKLNKSNIGLSLIPGATSQQMIVPMSLKSSPNIDVAFPVLHGTYGEDGTVQGLLEILDVPYVGAGVLGSAVGMDKDVAKRLLRDAGLPIAKFIALTHEDKINFDKIKKQLGIPLFVKPANNGSSVGVSKAFTKAEFNQAIKEAFKFDNKILVEQFIQGREIEISVLGNELPIASVPGEVTPSHDFYSYDAKYIDEHGAILQIPAKVSKPVIKKLQTIALAAYKVLGIEGMARVDMFLTKNDRIVINELNTIPGFTKISMYPKLWEASGVHYSKLLDMLIKLAVSRHHRQKKLKTNY